MKHVNMVILFTFFISKAIWEMSQFVAICEILNASTGNRQKIAIIPTTCRCMSRFNFQLLLFVVSDQLQVCVNKNTVLTTQPPTHPISHFLFFALLLFPAHLCQASFIFI